MRSDLLILASELCRRGEPFVLATVVRRQAPSSAQVGDTALITRGGAFHGWLGGSCTQPSVEREALRALADGEPRLVALSPDPEADRRAGVTALPMTCYSGGSVDVYIEPVLPAPRLVVFGVSPVARALARLGTAVGYAVDGVDPDADRAAFPDAARVLTELDAPELRGGEPGMDGPVFAVVATMGQSDEDALEAALALRPAYVGLVASRRRAGEVLRAVLARGAAAASLEAVRSPAGLDIGARAPEEIALSVLAEIVQSRSALASGGPEGTPQAVPGPAPEGARGPTPAPAPVAGVEAAHRAAPAPAPSPAPAPADEHVDPVCGMTVSPQRARHRAEHGGRTYWFCCGGCRQRFLNDPERYAGVRAGGAG